MSSPEEVTSHAGSILPIPAATDPTLPTVVPAGESATNSHALANEAVHKLVGASQLDHNEPEVKDLGWNDHVDDIPAPLVGGLPNEELWTLVRRFNKQMYHVKEMHTAPPGGLDLNIADDEEFSPDKLRANVERLYMTVIVGMVAFVKHIARLRSWNERKRTAAFAAAYLVAWVVDMIIPLIVGFIVVLIVYPPARPYLFPPAPIALVNSKTGGLQEPKAGMLGSGDSLTGAPEKHQGEAVEQEASNFVSGFASIAVSSATGKHPTTEAQESADGSLGAALPDPTALTSKAADAKSNADGSQASVKHDKTKQPVEDAMWVKMRPIMHIIGDISDGWERMGNALSPTPPFPENAVRLRLAGIIAPMMLPAFFVSSYMVMKGLGAGVGFGFFGQPLITRGLTMLNRKFPHWQKLLEIRNTILKGVPTNAQLTITLLRMGEANKAPLPPPPTSDIAPSDAPINPHDDPDYDLSASLDAHPDEMRAAIHPDPIQEEQTEHPSDKHMPDSASPPKKKFSQKILSVFKHTTKVGVETGLGADKLKATIGSSAAKNRLGVIPDPKAKPEAQGPVDFPCRFHGKKGVMYISREATTPCVSFSFTGAGAEGISKMKQLVDKDARHEAQEAKHNEVIGEGNRHIKPVFSLQIQDIAEVKKVGGLGWKGKIVVGWALDASISDGLEIVDRKGEHYMITAIQLREELFNRLVSIGNQRWESW